VRWFMCTWVGAAVLLAAWPASGTVAECREELFFERNFRDADAFCEAAVDEDPEDGEARLFRAVTRLLALLVSDEVDALLDGFGVSEEGRDPFLFDPALPTSTVPRGFRSGSTTSRVPFSVTGSGPVEIDVLAWERDDIDSDGDLDFAEPIDVNGDGEIAFFDAMILLFFDDGVLGTDDLIAVADFDSFDGDGLADGSVSHRDPFLAVQLDPGDYLLVVAPFGTDVEEAIEGVSSVTSDPSTLEAGERIPADHGDYRVTFGGATSTNSAEGTIEWLFEHLASKTPRGGDIQSAVAELWVPALEASAADLATIGDGFSTTLTSAELAALGFEASASVEVDLGDARLLEAWMRFLLGLARTIGAFDLDFDVAAFVDGFATGTTLEALKEDETNLLRRLQDADPRLDAARAAFRDAVDAYLAGSAFIRGESDPQEDDLATIPPGDPDEARFRAELLAFRSSLDGATRILEGEGARAVRRREDLNDLLGTDFGPAGVLLDLSGFFDASFDLRDLTPPLRLDSSGRGDLVEVGAFPDPTLEEVLVPEPSILAQGVVAVALLVVLRVGAARRRRR